MKVHLKKMNLLDLYDLSRPKSRSPPVIIGNQETVVAILKDPSAFPAPYAEKVARVVQGKGLVVSAYPTTNHLTTDQLLPYWQYERAEDSYRRLERLSCLGGQDWRILLLDDEEADRSEFIYLRWR